MIFLDISLFRNILDFWNGKSAALDFFSVKDSLLLFLEKVNFFPFSGIEQVQWWHVYILLCCILWDSFVLLFPLCQLYVQIIFWSNGLDGTIFLDRF